VPDQGLVGGAAASSPDVFTPSAFLLSPQLQRSVKVVLIRIVKRRCHLYSKDGTVWRNKDGTLPARGVNYYREFTVVVGKPKDRGTHRLVIGRDGTVWYSADHYLTLIEVARISGRWGTR
jgi:guanyl-specific ribonuclease Sa